MPKPVPALSREQFIERLRTLGRQLGKRALTRHDVVRELRITTRQMKRFGTFRQCATEAGLLPYIGKAALSNEELLKGLRDDIAGLDGPLQAQHFEKVSRYCMATYRTRWRSWRGALTALLRWLERHEPGFPKLDAIRKQLGNGLPPAPTHAGLRERPCGPPLNFQTLRHAPMNEHGVVFLFGALAAQLGFVVETLASAFPDCTAKRRLQHPRETWVPVRIEFEHESRNFKTHGHDPQGCDLIVCWEHNWPDCPLEVIELKKVVATAGG
jgi:hypothetical protein